MGKGDEVHREGKGNQRIQPIGEGSHSCVFGHLDPPYFKCSTRPIRELPGLEVDGERVSRVITSHRKVESEIEFLDKEDVLIVLSDRFFCEYPLQSLRHLMALILRQVTGLCGTIVLSKETLALET